MYHPVPTLYTKNEFEARYNPRDIMGYKARCEYIATASWFILVKEQAEILANFLKGKKVLEVCAGVGYLAAHMRQLGVTDYIAIDVFGKNHPSGNVNYGVTQRSAFNVTVAKADVVIMTWPNYNSNLADTIVRQMRKDQVLIYQGEDWGGCTGDDRFHRYIGNPDKFVELSLISQRLKHYQVQWSGIYDEFTVLKKLVNR